VGALQDAERVGRQRWRDSRRGLLGTSGSGTAVLPGVAEIAQLVDTVRAAGVDVKYSLLATWQAYRRRSDLGCTASRRNAR